MKKDERLHHRSLVEGLFNHGKSFYEYPLRVTWRKMSEEQLTANFRNKIPDGIAKVQMMVTVPKKRRRKAVDRVLLRRRIRESYRLNRERLLTVAYDNTGLRTFSVAFVYMHNDNATYAQIDVKMRSIIARLCKILEKQN